VDLTFVNSEEIPQPKDQVRLRSLGVAPYPDGRRIRVDIRVTPFLERPNIGLAIIDPEGATVSEAAVVEADHPDLTLTMHLRQAPSKGEYTLRGVLSFAADPPQDAREETFRFGEG
jgi:hypothetical protein